MKTNKNGTKTNVKEGAQGFQRTTKGKDSPTSQPKHGIRGNTSGTQTGTLDTSIYNATYKNYEAQTSQEQRTENASSLTEGDSPQETLATAEYASTNAERRARIRREVEEKPLMNYKYAYCPDCGQSIRVNTTRTRTFAVPHSGCPYGHLYREAEYDHDRMCAEVVIGDDEGPPLNGYVAQWREERVEVFAETTLDAQKLAMEEFKSVAGHRKVHPDDVTSILAEKNGRQVTHAPMF